MAAITPGKLYRAAKNLRSVREMVVRNTNTTRESLDGMMMHQRARDIDVKAEIRNARQMVSEALGLLEQAAADLDRAAAVMERRTPKRTTA